MAEQELQHRMLACPQSHQQAATSQNMTSYRFTQISHIAPRTSTLAISYRPSLLENMLAAAGTTLLTILGYR